MNTIVFLVSLTLASCIGLALGYGSVMTGQNKFTAYPYAASMGSMGSMGYGYMPMPYMGSSGLGGFGVGGGSSSGIFGSIISLFMFIFVINLLFSGSGGLKIAGLGGKSSSSYDHGHTDFY